MTLFLAYLLGLAAWTPLAILFAATESPDAYRHPYLRAIRRSLFWPGLVLFFIGFAVLYALCAALGVLHPSRDEIYADA